MQNSNDKNINHICDADTFPGRNNKRNEITNKYVDEVNFIETQSLYYSRIYHIGGTVSVLHQGM